MESEAKKDKKKESEKWRLEEGKWTGQKKKTEGTKRAWQTDKRQRERHTSFIPMRIGTPVWKTFSARLTQLAICHFLSDYPCLL